MLVDTSNKHAYCAVSGKDAILELAFDATAGALSPAPPREIKTQPGSRPRRLALHPSGRFLYAVNENTATVGAYAVDKASGGLKEVQFADMLPAGHKGEIAGGDLHITPDGRLLYASERRTSTLAGFRLDPERGTLSPLGSWPTETTPNSFAIDPRGRFLLSVGRDSNHLTAYAIRANGTLEPAKQHELGKMPSRIEVADLR